MDHVIDEPQLVEVRVLLVDVFGASLVGAWLHGSAVLGGLRPTSDLDVLAMVEGAPTEEQRRALLAGLLQLSSYPAQPGHRPLEVTVVVGSDITPWRYPPTATFQFGEWLRDRYEAGLVPSSEPSTDLALLLHVARRGDRSLVGPPPRTVLPAVPADDLRHATLTGVDDLLADLHTDTRNVLLTLARVLSTLRTGTISTKDEAANQLLRRLPDRHHPVLIAARDDYLAVASPSWPILVDDATALARWCDAEIALLTGRDSEPT